MISRIALNKEKIEELKNRSELAESVTLPINDFKEILKDLELLELIKKGIWKSDDNYYIDLCITKNNDNKKIYELLEQIETEEK